MTWGNGQYGGDSTTVREQLVRVQNVQATDSAFAAILESGSVVTWGGIGYGGDSTAFREQLKQVREIQATQQAFAAILEDGSVVIWGDSRCGGNCSAIREQLRGVQKIQASSLSSSSACIRSRPLVVPLLPSARMEDFPRCKPVCRTWICGGEHHCSYHSVPLKLMQQRQAQCSPTYMSQFFSRASAIMPSQKHDASVSMVVAPKREPQLM